VELFDLGKDPGEANNLAAAKPQRVQELQARVLELAGQMSPPLFLMELVSLGLSVAPVFPDGDMSLVNQD
ncbi:MAG: sulfatase, partial [Aestuariivirga sp.]